MLVGPDPSPAQLRGMRFHRIGMSLLFYAQWLFVIGVSVFDNLLTIQFHDQMSLSELNPMGRALLHINSGGITCFVVVKGLGTIIAATIALLVYWHCPRIGLPVITGLTVFQLALLWFLMSH